MRNTTKCWMCDDNGESGLFLHCEKHEPQEIVNRLVERNVALSLALQPFADAGELYLKQDRADEALITRTPDDKKIGDTVSIVLSNCRSGRGLTIGDLRAAARALRAKG